MAERDPEYHTTNDETPGQHNTLEAFLLDVVSEEVQRIKAKRLPQARMFAMVQAVRLPSKQTFATADDFAVFLVRQYQARARSRGLAMDCIEMILLPRVATEVFNEMAEAGHSLAFPREARHMEIL